MALGINSSAARVGQRNINTAQNRLGSSLSKLSSGRGINKAADNAAALAIAEQLRSDITSASQAQRNISDGRSMTRVAEGGLSQSADLLARGRELSIQAANGTLNDQQRSTIQNEITSIKEELTRISDTTEFNGQKTNDGSLGAAAPEVAVQAGIQNSSADRISMNVVEDTDAAALGVDTVDVSTQAGAQAAIDSFDSAIAQVSDQRASIGALQNRFDSAANNLAVTRENLSSAESQIRDLDYAAESTNFANSQILQQAATSVLKQGLNAQAGVIGSLLNIRS